MAKRVRRHKGGKKSHMKKGRGRKRGGKKGTRIK